MSFFAKRKLKTKVLKVDLTNPELDQPLTARQILHMFAITNGCQNLETAVLQHSNIENIPEDIKEFFVEVDL